MPGNQTVLFIVGPTASGKTRLSLEIALQTHVEIVSADSRQLYRHMDIGTAKPLPEERKRVPHHMIDILEPDADFNAGEYSRMARRIISEIFERGVQPLVVGGSGLYIKSIVDGIFEGETVDPALRQHLKQRVKTEGSLSLHADLTRRDPDSAAKIHPNDAKRIIRALEIYTVTGRPASRMQQEETRPADFPYTMFGLRWDRTALCNRIDTRVDAMMGDGLIEEVSRLKKMGYEPELNSLDSVGYKEVFGYLSGARTLQETTDLIKQNTRRFAKRQMTWFRRDQRITWIDLEDPVNWGNLAQRIAT